jgi:hypothetical protein
MQLNNLDTLPTFAHLQSEERNFFKSSISTVRGQHAALVTPPKKQNRAAKRKIKKEDEALVNQPKKMKKQKIKHLSKEEQESSADHQEQCCSHETIRTILDMTTDPCTIICKFCDYKSACYLQSALHVVFTHPNEQEDCRTYEKHLNNVIVFLANQYEEGMTAKKIKACLLADVEEFSDLFDSAMIKSCPLLMHLSFEEKVLLNVHFMDHLTMKYMKREYFEMANEQEQRKKAAQAAANKGEETTTVDTAIDPDVSSTADVNSSSSTSSSAANSNSSTVSSSRKSSSKSEVTIYLVTKSSNQQQQQQTSAVSENAEAASSIAFEEWKTLNNAAFSVRKRSAASAAKRRSTVDKKEEYEKSRTDFLKAQEIALQNWKAAQRLTAEQENGSI